MSLIAFLIVGLLAGWLAGLFVEGHGFGPFWDIVVGAMGALVGGVAFDALGVNAYGFWGSVIMAVIGSILFLILIGFFAGKSKIDRPLR
jgi:uncharacterized membrane protein YeaQ/YmgE (transglycosylase-associated protein family)